ncbi:fumarylacetoacetate hydrolase family protein [Nocardia pseudovaccinii]|uniref:fumarylacetoacetate hydrolase family protein n=1 Tax=Nocardia pseudovaccinii TaxID=189540 RepID=UPI0007A4A469|nr:fumarylacetoacetate hydrolase family protein [Nocardia pseudovaccinii]
MRIFNLSGRLSLAVEGGAVDVETASAGRFSADVQAVYDRWGEFRSWADAYRGGPDRAVHEAEVGPPVPSPRQVFAIGMNFVSHAAEAGVAPPATPVVFTKFPASITGPYAEIVLPSDTVDFEVELVAVIGRRARNVPVTEAWSYIAGLTAGQDISDRGVQLGGTPPQFSMGKSFEGFSPIGPAMVTADEFDDPEDIELGCWLSGERMQKGRTNDFIFGIPQLVAYLSAIVPLLPGDLIFTGTPSGVGWTREPRRTITPEDELVTDIAGIGEMRHRFVRQS